MKYLLSLHNTPGKTCHENPPGARLQQEIAYRDHRGPPCASCLLAKDASGYQTCFSFLPSPLVILLCFHTVQPLLNMVEESSNPNQDQDSCFRNLQIEKPTEGRTLVVCEHPWSVHLCLREQDRVCGGTGFSEGEIFLTFLLELPRCSCPFIYLLRGRNTWWDFRTEN